MLRFMSFFAFSILCILSFKGSSLRENPNEMSWRNVVVSESSQGTLGDKWQVFSYNCDFGHKDDAISTGIEFSKSALEALDSNLLDEVVRSKIMFICNSELLNLISIFSEDEIISNEELKLLVGNLSRAVNR